MPSSPMLCSLLLSTCARRARVRHPRAPHRASHKRRFEHLVKHYPERGGLTLQAPPAPCALPCRLLAGAGGPVRERPSRCRPSMGVRLATPQRAGRAAGEAATRASTVRGVPLASLGPMHEPFRVRGQHLGPHARAGGVDAVRVGRQQRRLRPVADLAGEGRHHVAARMHARVSRASVLHKIVHRTDVEQHHTGTCALHSRLSCPAGRPVQPTSAHCNQMI